jgi:chromosome partitioning protein
MVDNAQELFKTQPRRMVMTLNIQNLIQRAKIGIPEIARIAITSRDMLTRVRGHMLSPDRRKKAPTFTIGQAAALCGVTKPQLEYKLKKMDLIKQGEPTGKARAFTLGQVQELTRNIREGYTRPEGARAVVIAVGNFKGGVSKTTTTMCLAQGLALKGHKVLTIDADPQGSLTALFGLLSDAEIPDEMTVGRVLIEPEENDTLAMAVQKTYWEGIDLIAANTNLYAAEFSLPARQMTDSSFRFWDVLNSALDELREQYDVILIDTPPALSYLTINAFMASDALIIPLPPNNLDFASSVQFWNLFGDLSSNLMESAGLTKKFDFINILLSRVDASDVSSSVVREWIQATYADKVLPVEVPKTTVTVSASTEFGTVYDITRYEGSMKTYRRARDAYDRVADLIEQAIVVSWHQQIAESK